MEIEVERYIEREEGREGERGRERVGERDIHMEWPSILTSNCLRSDRPTDASAERRGMIEIREWSGW